MGWLKRKPRRYRVVMRHPDNPLWRRISEPRARSEKEAAEDMRLREAEFSAATGSPLYVLESVEPV